MTYQLSDIHRREARSEAKLRFSDLRESWFDKYFHMREEIQFKLHNLTEFLPSPNFIDKTNKISGINNILSQFGDLIK